MNKVVLVVALLLSGCGSTQKITSSQPTTTRATPPPAISVEPAQSQIEYSDTMEIIRSAAEAAPDKVNGEYILEIKAAGSQGPFVYLNTEFDYRDQRAVTVAIHPRIISQFEAKYGSTPQDFFVDKSIKVTGEAQRVRINFNSGGKPSGKYYYQTHIRVFEISQIEVVKTRA